MGHVGIDFHRVDLVLAAVHDSGPATGPKRLGYHRDPGGGRAPQAVPRRDRGDRDVPLALRSPAPHSAVLVRLTRGLAEVKVDLRTLLDRHFRVAPYRVPFGPRGVWWFRGQGFGPVDDDVRGWHREKEGVAA